MFRTILFALCAAAAGASMAQATDGTPAAAPSAVEAWLADPKQVFDATAVDLPAFQWIARPIVVFADTPADPRFREQIALLAARADELARRDVVVIVDADPEARSAVRTTLRPRGFMVALVGKDGGVKLRKPFPWDVRELTRAIDKMPMRQEELRAIRDAGG